MLTIYRFWTFVDFVLISASSEDNQDVEMIDASSMSVKRYVSLAVQAERI